jgi:hypothetical protein
MNSVEHIIDLSARRCSTGNPLPTFTEVIHALETPSRARRNTRFTPPGLTAGIKLKRAAARTINTAQLKGDDARRDAAGSRFDGEGKTWTRQREVKNG